MNKLLFLYKVAEKLGVHVNTVKKWRRDGVIKAIKLPGGRFRRPESEVLRILGEEVKEPRIIVGYARVSNQKKRFGNQNRVYKEVRARKV